MTRRWLVLQGYEVVCFLGDCGQEEDFDAVKAKALKLGAEKMIIENVQQELIDDLVWPAIQCKSSQAVYSNAAGSLTESTRQRYL